MTTPYVPVVLAYDHSYRRVNVESVHQSKGGHWLITGRDMDREGEYRTFRVDKIKGRIHILKGDHGQANSLPLPSGAYG
jgi:hypothetical protein